MPAVAPLVHETSTSTGTGNFTIAAVNGKQTFNSAFGTGGTDLFDYFISSRDNAEWEQGTGHLLNATTLVRDTIINSSTILSGVAVAVTFSAGSSDVTNGVDGAKLVQTDLTQTLTGKTLTSPVLTTPQLTLEKFTVGAAPSAVTRGQGAEIYVTDETGGETPAASNGLNWRRLSDLTAIKSIWTDQYPGNAMGLAFDMGRATLAGVDKVPSDILSCTRASTGFAEDLQGNLHSFASNVLRITDKGLLAEEARTNLRIDSEDIAGSNWNKQTNVTATSNQATAPDGTLTADKISWASASNNTGIFGTLPGTVSTSTDNTKSIYVRADTPGGTVGLTDPQATVGETILTLTVEWQRITLSETQTGGSANIWLRRKSDSPDHIYAWGGMLEDAPFASSYIKTTATSATRAADNVTFSDFTWIDAATGTLLAEYAPDYVSHTANIFTIQDAGANTDESYVLAQTSAAASVSIEDGGVSQFSDNFAASLTVGVYSKSALSYAANDGAFSVDGGTSKVDTSITLPTVTRAFLGSHSGTSVPFSGYIKRIAYWDIDKSNAEIETLTT